MDAYQVYHAFIIAWGLRKLRLFYCTGLFLVFHFSSPLLVPASVHPYEKNNEMLVFCDQSVRP